MCSSNIAASTASRATTALHFDPRPTRLAVNAATYHFDLAPQQVALAVRRGVLQQAGRRTSRCRSSAACWRIAARCGARRAGATSIETSNNIFNEVLCQSMADLNMLMTETAAGPLSLCRHSLVLDDVRPRRHHHRAADAVDRSARRARRAQAARRLPGQGGRSARRRRARQDPARNARRRDGGAARGAVRAILRQRRCDAAVRAAGRPLCRAHRRRRDAAPSCGPRSRRRCAGSTAPAIPTATASSNISARPNRASPIRAGRIRYDAIFHADGRLAEGYIALAEVQGYVFAGKRLAARCALRLGKRDMAQQARGRSATACRALRGGVLVRRTRHLRARARRRQAALPGAHLECRAAAVQRHHRAKTARAWSPPI